jgi:heat shock protein HslJ
MTLRNATHRNNKTALGPTRLALGFLAVVLASVFSVSCDDDDLLEPSDLMGGEWRLESIQPAGGSTVTPSDPNRYTVDFGDGGRVDVTADCNGCSGTYSVSDESLTVSSLTCTLIACASPTVGEQFARILEGRASVDLDGDRLTVSSDEGRLVFRR